MCLSIQGIMHSSLPAYQAEHIPGSMQEYNKNVLNWKPARFRKAKAKPWHNGSRSLPTPRAMKPHEEHLTLIIIS